MWHHHSTLHIWLPSKFQIGKIPNLKIKIGHENKNYNIWQRKKDGYEKRDIYELKEVDGTLPPLI